jgi:hypothetical protein
MSKPTRREILQAIATAALAGPLSAQQARHVHQEAAKDAAATGGVYHPKALTPHEFRSLERLCELIVPGASKGQAAGFIDLLSSQNPEMAAIYTGGLAWLDHYMELSMPRSSAPRPQTRSPCLTGSPTNATALRNWRPESASSIGPGA